MDRVVLYTAMPSAVKSKRKYDATFRKEQALVTRHRILEAARRLLARGTYSSLTMADIADEAGVAYQTVYATFGTKVRLAEALVEAGFSHIPSAMQLFENMFESPDVDHWFRTASQATRLILEPCADLVRFIRESGDPGLLAGYQKREQIRYDAIATNGVVDRLVESHSLKPHLSPPEAVAVIWALTGAELYNQLVFGQGWSPARYEEWLADALMAAVVKSPPNT